MTSNAMPLIRNLCLLLVACVVGLVLCEGSLRLFYPQYAPLAEARARFDTLRLRARIANNRATYLHPDTGSIHAWHHNNLALRQHRNFSTAEIAAATNVGVFGDSFVENIRMDAPYSLTEPLDYLLNQSGRRFNVLNFGVDGYGPGQSLLHYEHFRYAEDLAHVLYVYCENDLDNLVATALFHPDEAGRLVQHEATRSSWWVTRMGRLHLPYLILDATGRLSNYVEKRGRRERRKRERLLDAYKERRTKVEPWRQLQTGAGDDEDLGERLAIFRRLIRRWKQGVEHNGANSMLCCSRITILRILPAFPTSYRRKTSKRSASTTVLAPMRRTALGGRRGTPPRISPSIASKATCTGMKRAIHWPRSVCIGCWRRTCSCRRCRRRRYGQRCGGIMRPSGDGCP